MTTMQALSRRGVLLRATGAALALHHIAGASTGEAASSLETACTFASASLQRGLLVHSAADAPCLTPAGTTAIFQAASLSKPVVASLALKPALCGLLDLDQPLSELLPDGYAHRQNLFALREPPIVDIVSRDLLRKLTVRTLLSHTSGLPNWSSTGPLQLSFEPGAQWQYSGEGFVLIQHVLCTLTGSPLQEFASDTLFRPLGLRKSAFKVTDEIAMSLVPGRSTSGAVRQLRFESEIAANSLYTSAGDYAMFLASVLADEAILSLVARSPVPVSGAPNVYWGLGWGIERAAERTYIWHWGNNPGFRALVMADLNTKDSVVALSASENGMPMAKSRVQQALPGAHPGLDLRMVR